MFLLGVVGLIFYDKQIMIDKMFSFSDRWETWQETIKLWWKMPYTGMGLGNFRTHNLLINSTRWWQVHNEYLQVLQEMGIIGLGLVALVLTDFFRRISFNRREIACGLVIIAGMVNSLISFPLHIAPIVFVLILGFAFKEIIEKEEMVLYQQNM